MPHLSLHSLHGVEDSSPLRSQLYSPGDPVNRKLSQWSEGKERSWRLEKRGGGWRNARRQG